MKPTFLMLVGLPASGKSTLAKEIMKTGDDIVYLSSDALRLELFGDENNQDNNGVVFNEMAVRTRQALKDGKHVIYDATNVSRKKRKGLLQQLPKDTQKTAVYMATDYKVALNRNNYRKRVVPQHVIDKMYKTMQIPIYSEGWDRILFYYNNDAPIPYASNLRFVVKAGKDYELMTLLASCFDEFLSIYELPQDSTYHSFSVSRHIYYVYKYVLENYKGEDKELMLWAALLHDIGKAFCKSFVNRKGEETRYANFIGHDSVGSQIAVNFLRKLGFDDEFIYKVATLIQFHMYLLDQNANRQKLLDYVGQDLFDKLEFLREADTQAH